MTDNPDCPCGKPHIPNEETRKTLEDSRAGRNLTRYDSLEAFWAELDGLKEGDDDE